MNDPVSSRSVFIMKAKGSRADIEVSRPSDCLLLQRDHVKCHKVNDLTVRFSSKHIVNVGVADEEQSPDTWKKALYHLLNTYRPVFCFLNTKHHQTGIANGYKVKMTDGTSYGAYWNESQSLLSIRE